MQSRRSLNFSAQLLLLLIFSCLVEIITGRGVNSSTLDQFNDCTCLGCTQTFECSIIGGGVTIWNSTFLDCQNNDHRILLRHSQYDDMDSQANRVECNHGAIIAKHVGVLDGCYTSQLVVTIGEEMINETITCIHDDFSDSEGTIVGQKSLTVTEIPYPPPRNVHLESNDSNQITFAWDELVIQCPSLRYVITAINCGVCPNTTTDTNVTCVQSNVSVHTNHICLFAVQTEICGYLLGGKSEYVTVYIQFDAISASESEDEEYRSTTIMSVITGSEMVNDSSSAILIPLVSGIMSIGVILLLLVVIALCVFMSKQVTKTKSIVNTTATVSQNDQFANRAQNNRESIYSMLQPSDGNNKLSSDHVVYADIGPSPGEQGLHCVTSLCFQDDRVEYAEIKPVHVNHESVLNQLTGKLPRQVEDGNNGIESFPTALTTSASGSSF